MSFRRSEHVCGRSVAVEQRLVRAGCVPGCRTLSNGLGRTEIDNFSTTEISLKFRTEISVVLGSPQPKSPKTPKRLDFSVTWASSGLPATLLLQI